MYANHRNFRAIQEIAIEKHDGDVRLYTGSGNAAVSRICNASGHNYRNSSVIVDLAMGQLDTTFHRTYLQSKAKAKVIDQFVCAMV